jgi:hypothetical protein
LKGEGCFTNEGIANEFDCRGITYLGGKLWGIDAVRFLAAVIEQSMIEVAAMPGSATATESLGATELGRVSPPIRAAGQAIIWPRPHRK